MLQKNCRVEDLNGVRFYEQDILFDDYSYIGNIQISLTAKYYNSGIGFALINSEGVSIRDKNELYLFRIGENETSVIYKKDGITKRILKNSINVVIPNESLNLVLKKIDKKVYLYMNDELLYALTLPNRLDSCNIGIYSNAGNIITNMGIASNIPDGWAINMSNSNGGYVKFIDNGFNIVACSNNVQVEQENIQMSAGTHYLIFSNEDINSDITAYAYLSDDDRPFDEDKNILKSDGSLYLAYDAKINLKFVGTNGTINNIHIGDNSTDRYVATKDNNSIIDGSYIILYTQDNNTPCLRQAKWTATIYDTPDELSQKDVDKFFVVADALTAYKLSDLGILKGIEYKYIFNATSNTLNIYKESELINSVNLMHVADRITLFSNVDATVSDFEITDMNNNITVLTLTQGIKKYVEDTITSPIIVADKDQGICTPLDLSSSYRIYFNGIYDEYIFTNVEREMFDVSNTLTLSKAISNQSNAIKIYGIKNIGNCNMDNLYRLEDKNLDTIESFSNDYVILDETDISEIRTLSKQIILNGVVESNKFDLIIVDYLKQDSYCINDQLNDGFYEIEISSAKKNINLLYDSDIISGSDKNLGILHVDKVTNITPQSNCYIVLRKES